MSVLAPSAPAGSEAALRLGDAADLARLDALHRRCTRETLRRRFHTAVPVVPQRLARQTLLPAGGWSVVAELGADLVGMACTGPLSGSDLEVGILVEDAHQGRGIGTRLLRHVADEAAARGYRSMVCLTEPDNRAAERALARTGLDTTSTTEDGMLEVTVLLRAADAAPRGRPGSPRRVRARRGGSPRP
ncbi:MAG TPA: GNAT family N-acetyltransferase [Nocardioides sp.]|nr:GNAT family N-acetyltransferase [Nocardioides sp.]